MTDEKILELINREIDGLLSEQERGELNEYLARHVEVRALHQDLKKISTMLSQVPAEEPSPNLKKRVLNAIPAKRYAPQTRALAQLFFPRLKFNFRYAYIFLFGLAIGFVATTAIFNRGNQLTLEGVSGSLVENRMRNQASVLAQLDLNNYGVSGNVQIKTAAEAVLSEVSWQSDDEVELQLEFEPQALVFAEMKNGETGGLQMKLESNRVHVRGKQVHCALTFLKLTESTTLRLAILKNGVVVFDEPIHVASLR